MKKKYLTQSDAGTMTYSVEFIPKKLPKAIDVCKLWLKRNCKKGELLRLLESDSTFVIMKASK